MATSLVDLIPRDSGSRYQQSGVPPQPNPATSGIHSTELGRNVYNAAMALPGIGGVAKLASTGGMISRAFNTAAGAANTASRGTAALATVPNAVPEAKAQTMSGAQPGQQQLGPSPSAPAGTPQTQSLVNAEEMQQRQAAQPTGQQVPGLSGVYKHGHGQYSDNPNGMGLPQNLGQPSAQNMQAANNLAGQPQKRSLIDAMYAQQERSQQEPPQQNFQMPRQESAYEREARMRERNSIMSRLQQPMTGDPRRDLTASQRQQMVAMLGQEGQERQSSERNLVDFARQQMSDQTQRYTADTHAGVGQQRNLIDAARLDMERKNQELVNRPRTMIAALQEQIAAEQDAAKRNGMVQRMRDIEGRNTEVDPYLVVPGGQQLNENGQAYTAPSAVFNRRTGDWLRQPGVGQQLPPNMSRQVGTSGGKPVYEDANGKRFIAG